MITLIITLHLEKSREKKSKHIHDCICIGTMYLYTFFTMHKSVPKWNTQRIQVYCIMIYRVTGKCSAAAVITAVNKVKEKKAYEGKEEIFEHPAQPGNDAGDAVGDESDGVCEG